MVQLGRLPSGIEKIENYNYAVLGFLSYVYSGLHLKYTRYLKQSLRQNNIFGQYWERETTPLPGSAIWIVIRKIQQ